MLWHGLPQKFQGSSQATDSNLHLGELVKQFLSLVLGMELQASHTLCQQSATELLSQLQALDNHDNSGAQKSEGKWTVLGA